jgi:DNA mismatch endonuclease (patch repair protein)
VPDVFTKAKRSEVMSCIRGQGNKDTEFALIRVFRAHRITGWRRQVEIRNLEFGMFATANPSSGGRKFRVRPDFVFPKLRVAVFVDGCFWHVCPKHATRPRHNRAFWKRKLEANTARDRLVTRTLRMNGWRVLRIWEHELARKNAARLVRRIRQALGWR